MYFKKIAGEPLIHFFVLGVLLFALVSMALPAEDDDRIIVDRDTLLTFIQYRSRAFDAQAAASMLDAMNSDERSELIDDFIREEALYREAKRLGADTGDYVIRQRMVQKVEFMAEAAASSPEPTRSMLEEYYASHKEAYFQPAEITFSHIFVSTDMRTGEEARIIAQKLLTQAQSAEAGFADASQYGERFIYNVNYVERNFEYVKSHFGKAVAQRLFADTSPLDQWIGPLESRYGVHVFFILSRRSGVTPPFDAVITSVAADYVQDVQKAEAEKVISAIIIGYKPTIKLDDAPASMQPAGDTK